MHDEEESLLETAAEQLPEMEIDEIFSQAVLCVETGHSSSDSFMIPESSALPTVQTFGAPVNLDALRASAIPEKTKKQTNCCVSRWKEWARSRNTSTGEEQAPEEPIEMSDRELGYRVQRFVTEIRKKDGAVYPSETLSCNSCHSSSQAICASPGVMPHIAAANTGRKSSTFKDPLDHSLLDLHYFHHYLILICPF